MQTHPRAVACATAAIVEQQGLLTEACLDRRGTPVLGDGWSRYADGSPVRLGDTCCQEVARRTLEHQLEQQELGELQLLPGWSLLGEARQAALLLVGRELGAPRRPNRGSAQRCSGQWAPWLKALTDGARTGHCGVVESVSGESALMQRARALWQQEELLPWRMEALRDTHLRKALLPLEELSAKGRQVIAAAQRLEVRSQQRGPAPGWAWVSTAAGERWLLRQADWRPVWPAPSEALGGPVDWGTMQAAVGPHWRVGEVLQHDVRVQPQAGGAAEAALIELVDALLEVPGAWGGEIGLCGGYRPAPYGQIEDGECRYGRALDLFPVEGGASDLAMWLSRRWSGSLELWKSGGFVRVGLAGRGETAFSRMPGPKRPVCTPMHSG